MTACDMRRTVLRLFYGLMISCETDGHESKPSSKGRSRITTGEKPHSYRWQRTERTASEDPLTTVVLMGFTCPGNIGL